MQSFPEDADRRRANRQMPEEHWLVSSLKIRGTVKAGERFPHNFAPGHMLTIKPPAQGQPRDWFYDYARRSGRRYLVLNAVRPAASKTALPQEAGDGAARARGPL